MEAASVGEEWRFNEGYVDAMREALKMHSSSDHIRKRTVRSARLVDNQINMGGEAAIGRNSHTSPLQKASLF